MKIVQNVAPYHNDRLKTCIYPYCKPDGDHTRQVQTQYGPGTAGCIEIDEQTGDVVLNYDTEWLWDLNVWNNTRLEKLADAMRAAVKLSRSIKSRNSRKAHLEGNAI